jgi:hypothetical protein
MSLQFFAPQHCSGLTLLDLLAASLERPSPRSRLPMAPSDCSSAARASLTGPKPYVLQIFLSQPPHRWTDLHEGDEVVFAGFCREVLWLHEGREKKVCWAVPLVRTGADLSGNPFNLNTFPGVSPLICYLFLITPRSEEVSRSSSPSLALRLRPTRSPPTVGSSPTVDSPSTGSRGRASGSWRRRLMRALILVSRACLALLDSARWCAY